MNKDELIRFFNEAMVEIENLDFRGVEDVINRYAEDFVQQHADLSFNSIDNHIQRS